MTTKLYSLLLSESEKQLFNEWLQSREALLTEQLQQVHLLRSKLTNRNEPEIVKEKVPEVLKQDSMPLKPQVRRPLSDQPSWTNKIINVFQLLNRSLISKEIIDWFVQNDASVQHKSREFVSKSVTSKLAVLEEKGIVTKESVDKKLVYTLVKDNRGVESTTNLFEDNQDRSNQI